MVGVPGSVEDRLAGGPGVGTRGGGVGQTDPVVRGSGRVQLRHHERLDSAGRVQDGLKGPPVSFGGIFPESTDNGLNSDSIGKVKQDLQVNFVLM